nr:hypothetical protein [Tanacetum cinerariifolium]
MPGRRHERLPRQALPGSAAAASAQRLAAARWRGGPALPDAGGAHGPGGQYVGPLQHRRPAEGRAGRPRICSFYAAHVHRKLPGSLAGAAPGPARCQPGFAQGHGPYP